MYYTPSLALRTSSSSLLDYEHKHNFRSPADKSPETQKHSPEQDLWDKTSRTEVFFQVNIKLDCGPMPNVMAALSNINGALCKSSVIPFLLLRRKLWLTPVFNCHAVTLPIQESARDGHKLNFTAGKIPLGGKSPQNAYTVYQCRRRPNIVQSLVDLR